MEAARRRKTILGFCYLYEIVHEKTPYIVYFVKFENVLPFIPARQFIMFIHVFDVGCGTMLDPTASPDRY